MSQLPVHLIEDQLPALTFLGENAQSINEFTPYGNIPIALRLDIGLRFQLIPQQQTITGLRLRVGTYCRVNYCHITIHTTLFTHRFSAEHLQDNEYVELVFPEPYACTIGKPIEITLYSDDATEDSIIAIWCAKKPPTFVQTVDYNPLNLDVINPLRVSIVIPVFNKVLYTYNCLLTVQACDPEMSKEVIIINNASSDDTSTLLAQLQGAFKVINNVENQGFVTACRQGAAIAQGEFILFLNNDTQVTPGWLVNMVKLMDTDKKIGITGSKLIYPDGRLQEAGGIIFNDASGWNYGRLQDPTDPKFNKNRVVDYCSGASLMIRRKLWEQLDGFDLRYIPAYYEDTDLCFAVRQAGYQVIYCHNSEVIHHEGITSGTDITSGYKAYQAINHGKFLEKWRDILEKYHLPPPPQVSPEQAALRLAISHGNIQFPSFFQQTDMQHPLLHGISPDYWMSKGIAGFITVPAIYNHIIKFIVKVYVPEQWHDYNNLLTLTLAKQRYQHPVKIGCQTLMFILPMDTFSSEILFFVLTAEKLYKPCQYDKNSQDTRELSMLLLEFGFFPVS